MKNSFNWYRWMWDIITDAYFQGNSTFINMKEINDGLLYEITIEYKGIIYILVD